MTKSIEISSKEEILQIVARFPEGTSLEKILQNLKSPIPKRTLQYRISSLVQRGLLETKGKARARVYLLPTRQSTKSSLLNLESFSIPLSPEGLAIKKKIDEPLHTRMYVSYNRDFLDRYRPNETFYLTPVILEKLLQLGTTDGKRPAGTFAKQIFEKLLIDLSWNSSRLEGNTYSLLETKRLLELGQTADGKDIKEAQMILNHKAAIEFMVDSTESMGINRYALLNLHALLSHSQNRFQEVIETELLHLHEGNIARFHLSLTKFLLWKKAFF